MAIAFVDVATSLTDTCSVPAAADGDLMIGFGFRNNVTPPTTPTGWTLITTVARSGASMDVSFRYKQSGDTSAQWTNATSSAIVAYSGCHATDPIGHFNTANANSGTVTIPSLTLEVTDGTAWAVSGYGHRSTAQFPTPSGMTERLDINDGSAGQLGASDTNTGVASFAGTTIAADASANWVSVSIELIAAAGGGGTNANVNAVTMTGSGTAPAPTISAGSAVSAVTATGSAQMLAPTVSTGSNAEVLAATATATGAALAPSVAAQAAVSPPVATGTGAMLAPVVEAVGGAEVLAVTMTATGAMLAPAVEGTVTESAEVEPPAMTATGAMLAPTIELEFPTFEPPTFERPMPVDIKPLPYYRITQGASVVRINGTLTTVKSPAAELLVGEEGVDFFRGGHVYEISDPAVLAELLASGYEVSSP